MMVEPVVEDLALGAFRLVKERISFEIDFTPDTLPVVDQYLIDLRAEDDGKPSEKVTALVVPCIGAYFGEVVRRSLPGGFRWHLPQDDYPGWRLEATNVFLGFNPIGVALEALLGTTAAGWNAHLALLDEQRRPVTRSLEATGAVREDDFHRLAVRHEVLEQTVLLLSALEREEPGGRVFGHDAYDALLSESKPAHEA